MTVYWTIPKMWNGDCWIIGGGTSMLHQFGIPSDIISKVEKKELPLSAYSEYLSPLHSKTVISTNVAFMLGEWITATYFCDAQFFRNYKNDLLKFRNLKITCVNHIDRHLLPETTNIKRLKRDYKPGLSFRPDTIAWNKNSGAAAINLAVLAGAKRILLLGFDMRLQEGRTHWHNVYSMKTPNPSFKRFLERYPEIAKDAKKAGVEILNISPDSALDCFPKLSLKEVL